MNESTKVVNMPLVWKASKPAPDPFEAIAGDWTEEYQVHLAVSPAVDPVDIEAAIVEVVKKALSFFEANRGERSARLLFLWDVVYADLTVVYTDDSMMYDARHVTKCHFPELDKAGTAEALSDRIRRMIGSSVAQLRHGFIPARMHAFYSCEDRASVAPEDFEVQQLTGDPG
jgi:hypothetical protein